MGNYTSNKTLCLFTHHYPFGTGEDYVHNELKVISKIFPKIYVFPIEASGESRKVEHNIEVITTAKFNKGYRLQYFLHHFKIVSKLFLYELAFNTNRISILKNILLYLDLTIINLHYYSNLKSFLKSRKLDNLIYYSFWMHDWATVLSMLHSQKAINKFITRVNGFDFREQMAFNNFIFPRQFQLAHTEKVIAVSKFALDTIKSNYPKYKKKFYYSPLGVFDKGINPTSINNNSFQIVSCSTLTPIKRVHLIPQILKLQSKNIHWIHFGDGNERTRIEKYCKEFPKNITYEIRGFVKNDEVLNYYKTKHVDLFVQLSETEGGVPVSIQEAISFGIPILGSNAGGIPETINKNGWLVEVEASIENMSKILNNIIKQKNIENERLASRKLFLEEFNAIRNHTEFFEKHLR